MRARHLVSALLVDLVVAQGEIPSHCVSRLRSSVMHEDRRLTKWTVYCSVRCRPGRSNRFLRFGDRIFHQLTEVFLARGSSKAAMFFPASRYNGSLAGSEGARGGKQDPVMPIRSSVGVLELYFGSSLTIITAAAAIPVLQEQLGSRTESHSTLDISMTSSITRVTNLSR